VEKEKQIEANYNKFNHVSQSNKLVRAVKDDMSIAESKLIRFVIAQIMKGDRELRTYSVNVQDFANTMKLNPIHLYEDFERIGDSIRKKGIRLERGTTDKDGKKNYRVIQWISSYEYENGTFTISLSPEMKNFLLDLSEYTDYQIYDIIDLNTDNSIKLYELLSSWKRKAHVLAPEYESFGVKLKKNEIIYGMDFLREYFNCQDKYPLNADFIRWIIEQSVNTISRKTVFPVSYRTVRHKGKIVAIVFAIGMGNVAEC